MFTDDGERLCCHIGGRCSVGIRVRPTVAGWRRTDRRMGRFLAATREGRVARSFSSRVISDGTLRLLALLTVLNDPNRGGVLCFEEPENGVHEARGAALIECLRSTAGYFGSEPAACFQILVNTHSPAVMAALQDEVVVVADLISTIRRGGQRTVRTRMRTGVTADSETGLTRFEVDAILRRPAEAV